MAYKIRDLRNLDINLYNFLASSIRFEGYTILSGYDSPYVVSGIYLLDGYPEDNFNKIKLPAIAINHINTRDEPFQLGQGKESIRKFTITVLARGDGERDDLGEMVKNYFDRTMNIHDYNIVLTGGSYVEIGRANFDNIVMSPNRDIRHQTTFYMMNINIDCRYFISSGSSLISN